MENEAPSAFGRGSKRDRFMGKFFGGRDRKQTNEEIANDVSDFLHGGGADRLQVTHPPPQPQAPPRSLKLDTANATRYPQALNIESQQQQQALPYRNRSHSPPRQRKKKNLAVRFVDTYPEVIGEGGDESQIPTVEISKIKRSKSAPTKPSPPAKELPPAPVPVAKPNNDDGFVPTPIRRTQTGYVSIPDTTRLEQPPAPIPPIQPRTLPAGDVARSRFLDPSEKKDENRRSFIEIHQQEQREAEGMAFAEATRSASDNSHHDWDQNRSSLDTDRDSPVRNRQGPAVAVEPGSPTAPPIPPYHPQRSPRLPASPGFPPAAIPPKSPQMPTTPENRLQAPNLQSSPGSLRSNSSFTHLPGFQPPHLHDAGLTPVPPNSSPMPTNSLHSVVNAAGDDAFNTYIARTKHLYELFRLHTETVKPLGSCRPEELARAALWWFIKGRMTLENAIRERPNSPESENRNMMLRFQAYTDLTKGYWLVELAIPEVLGGDYSAESELGEVRQQVFSYLRKLSMSMKRNGLLPPEEPFLPQTMDKAIWVEYPQISRDIVALLNGNWGSALTASQHPTPSLSLVEALPLGDTATFFNYGRFSADAYLMEQGIQNQQTYFPCYLSMVRPQQDPNLMFVIASQNGSIALRIQNVKGTGPTWEDVKWRGESSSLELRLPRGFILVIQCSQQDFRTLWSVYDFGIKVLGYLYPRKDEELVFRATLRGFQYFDRDPNSRTFPKENITGCELAMFERFSKEASPHGTRTFHKGFRISVVTGPRTRTLSGISHPYVPQIPIEFSFLRGQDGEPALQLGFVNNSDVGRMVLCFNDGQECIRLHNLLTGVHVHKDELVTAEVLLKEFRISQGLNDSEGFSSFKRLPWQRAVIVNDKYKGDVPPTVLAEKLRVQVDSPTRNGIAGTVTDRINVAPGELRLRLDVKDMLTLHSLRTPQQDMTIALSENLAPRESRSEFERALSDVQTSYTVRTYRFASLEDLHAFQAGITGFTVIFDAIASNFAVARRRMVVPIHKKWEAGTTRIQVVQSESSIQVLAFFEDWSHGQSMGFVLKGTDTFETSGKNGKAALKFVEAKFPLPRVPGEDGSGSDEVAFVCLDLPDYAGEHDDLTVVFENEEDRDRLAQCLPAPVKASRLGKLGK